MLYSGTDLESYITEYTLPYEDYSDLVKSISPYQLNVRLEGLPRPAPRGTSLRRYTNNRMVYFLAKKRLYGRAHRGCLCSTKVSP